MEEIENIEQREQVRRFVREGLGCGCPEEVFDQIQVGVEPEVIKGVGSIVRLVIGSRLLIYVMYPGETSASLSSVELVVARGVLDRDVSSFNRVRVVCCLPSGKGLDNLHAQLNLWVSTDEKAHLHLMKNSKIPLFISRLLA